MFESCCPEDVPPIGLNINIRFYKYSPGERFGKHIDDSCDVPELSGHSRYTLLVYLSQPVGGETVFYDHRGRTIASVAPKTGLALFHRHGEDVCLEHEAKPALHGIKYVLRSDVVFPGRLAD